MTPMQYILIMTMFSMFIGVVLVKSVDTIAISHQYRIEAYLKQVDALGKTVSDKE